VTLGYKDVSYVRLGPKPASCFIKWLFPRSYQTYLNLYFKIISYGVGSVWLGIFILSPFLSLGSELVYRVLRCRNRTNICISGEVHQGD
jgi:hypothetical protein